MRKVFSLVFLKKNEILVERKHFSALLSVSPAQKQTQIHVLGVYRINTENYPLIVNVYKGTTTIMVKVLYAKNVKIIVKYGKKNLKYIHLWE